MAGWLAGRPVSLTLIKSQKGDEKNGRGAATTPVRSPSLLPRNPSCLPFGRLVLPPLFVSPLFREACTMGAARTGQRRANEGRVQSEGKGGREGGWMDGWAGYGYGMATGWLRGGYDLRHFVFLFYRMLAGIASR